jgi:hypothetical protein
MSLIRKNRRTIMNSTTLRTMRSVRVARDSSSWSSKLRRQ